MTMHQPGALRPEADEKIAAELEALKARLSGGTTAPHASAGGNEGNPPANG